MNITTTRRYILVLALLSGIAAAHGGEEHVIGVAAKVSDASVTVKTTAGKLVEVGFDAKTTYSRAKAVVAKTDIKVGDRVVIHAIESPDKKLVAHTVELGGATAAKPATKPAAKQ